MNKVVIQDYNKKATKGCAISITNGYMANNDTSRITKQRYRNVPNYASFGGAGMDLSDESLLFAENGTYFEYENIGIVGSYTIGEMTADTTNKALTIDVVFSEPVEMPVFTIRFHNSVSCLMYYTVYDDNGRRLMYDYYYTDGESVLVWGVYAPQKRFTLTFGSATWSRTDTSLVQIDGIDFGRDIEITNIFGDISCYGELKLTCDDMPSGTCDFTAEFNEEPKEGTRIVVESDGFKGAYNIVKADRQSQTIYTVECEDDIGTLDRISTKDIQGFRISDTYQQIFNQGIDFVNDKNNEYIAEAVVSADNLSLRQALAGVSVAQLQTFSCFNSSSIYGIDFDSDHTPTKFITATRILGEAKYIKKDRYKEVTMTVKNTELNPETDKYESVEYSGTAATPNPGQSGQTYSMTDLRAGRSQSSLGGKISNQAIIDAIQITADYINGNEVEATIVYDGEQLGEWVQIQTPYNGVVTGIIQSIELLVNSTNTANIVIKEVDG